MVRNAGDERREEGEKESKNRVRRQPKDFKETSKDGDEAMDT
jgi:hypothetical protein